MLEMFAAQIMAVEAQRRYIDGVRLDGRVTDKPARWRGFVAALFTRSGSGTIPARARLDRLAAA